MMILPTNWKEFTSSRRPRKHRIRQGKHQESTIWLRAIQLKETQWITGAG